MPFPDYGDVPTWLATLGAAAAAVFAAKAYRAEVDRDRRAELDLEQAQAARVAAWDDEIIDLGGQNQWGLDSIPRVALRNASDLPVYDVVLFSYRYRCAEPTIRTPSGKWMVGVLPPGAEPLRRLPIEDTEQDSHLYVMQFRDAAGRTWHRDLEGVLRPGPYSGDLDAFAERLWEEDA